MKKDTFYLVCGPIERMVFPLFKKFNCCECGMEIGASEPSYNTIKDKDFKPICEECFMGSSPQKSVIMRPNKEQLKELRTKIPDFGETEIRDAFNKLKKRKDWELR